ncbi:tail protein with lysin activity [Bacillus phage SP-10]|uniref:tail protein with lysin activity n=1 Tax=Bacillus phage SP10 TaxID=941058 RepID=UPI0002198B6D|nr:tail protein with lysin activity [Bacillus phage SP-10]BAK52965.1 tail protein [Bacillus phage SP-10]
MGKVKRFKPEATVSFYTEKGEIVARSKPKKQGDAIDGDVLQISTQNDLANDAGVFQIVLTAKNRWDKKIASNDLVIIKMHRNDDDKEDQTIMFGLVDDVRKTVSVGDETVERNVLIMGRNFAKALINFEVGVVQEVEMTTASLGWLEGRVNFMGENAANIVKQVMNDLVFKYMEYEFENGKKIKELVHMKLSSRKGERLFDDKSFINFQGSMYSFLKEIVDEPFNQMFWETYKGKNTLVVRETPFNKDNWNDLKRHEITDDDVVSESIGRSDLESYALFSVGMQSFFNSFDVSKTVNVFPLWYEPYFKKYGLRRLNRYTAYVGYGNAEDAGDVNTKLESYQRDLFNWNIMNPTFFNGTIVVKGRNKYKIGERLLYKSTEDGRDIEFFVEGVSQEFVNMNHWYTTLTVTRGLEDSGKNRFKKPWGEGVAYQGGALGTPAAADMVDAGTTDGIVYPGGSAEGIAAQLIANAKSWLNKPNKYVFGGGRNTSDIMAGRFDCSSWVRYIFETVGINVGPISGTTTDTLAKQGSPVKSVMALKPGDLVMFNTYKHNGHVTIYLGNGEAIGSQSSTGVGIIKVSTWQNKYGLGSLRRIL